MRRIAWVLAAVMLLPATVALGQGKGRGPGGGGPPGQGGGPPTVEASNNLSYPVIFGEGAGNEPAGWSYLAETDWTFATVTDATQCYPTVPLDEAVCWHSGSTIWWLQQRPENQWQAPAVAATSALPVTAVDWGDLLESRTNLNTRSLIRVETVLYEDTTDSPGGVGSEGLFALAMSPAVPGTENSPTEMRGTNQSQIDPELVHPGFDATVYSACARLLIQKVTGDPTQLSWSGTDGTWVNGADAPFFDGATYDGGLTAEVNVGGNLIYGYNLNMRTAGEGAGLYRFTFVLDGGTTAGGPCPVTLQTYFDAATTVANVGGTTATAVVIPAGDARLNGDVGGGLTYIDVAIASKPGGGGGGRR